MLAVSVLSQLLLASAVLATSIGHGFVSNCFNPTFEAQYTDMSNRPVLYFGVTVLVDYRYLGSLITREYLEQCFDSANKYFLNAKFQLVNLQILELGPGFAPDVDQQGDWMTTSAATWTNALQPYFGQGRVLMLIAQTKAVGGSYVAGRLQGTFPQNTNGSSATNFLWMNTDALGTGVAPALDVETMVHELSHGFGLFHTFETQFGCSVGDAVNDTVQTTNRACGCKQSGADTCGVQRTSLDCTNIMSYGTCRTGTALTPQQYRRMRCVIENDITTLTALSDSNVADLPVLAPAPQQSTVQGVLRCNGIPGACIDTNSAKCGVPTLPDRCPGATGNVACCPYKGAPWVTYLPGTNQSCLGGVAGTCQDVDRQPCARAFLGAGFCAASASQVRCCPAAGATIPSTPPALAVNPSTTASVGNTVALPIGYTLHVGDSLYLPLPQALSGVGVYLLLTDVVYSPAAGDVAGFDVDASYSASPAGVTIDELLAYTSGAVVDRGTYMLVVTGTDGSGTAQTYVSTLFTIDVNSCAVEDSSLGVPYGLERTMDACLARNGTVVDTMSNLASGTICCMPAAVASDFFPRPGQNGTDAPLGQIVQWFGLTSFWGAPMQLTLLSAADDLLPAPLSLISVGSNVASLSDADVTLGVVGDVQSFTPIVGNPGQFQLLDATGEYASSAFSVVSLPCELSTGVAGYCMPTKQIMANDGTTDASEVCTNGETAPCVGLAVSRIPFACCQQGATAIQKQAAYLMQLATYKVPSGEFGSGASTLTTALSCVWWALSLAVLAAHL